MVNSLLVATLVLFIVGSLLSTAVTRRDFMAIKHIEGNMRWRQWILVCSDVVQISFFLFGIASIIQSRSDRVESAIAWALQCMAGTNVRSPLLFLSSINSLVYTASTTHLFRCLVAACNSCGAAAIRSA